MKRKMKKRKKRAKMEKIRRRKKNTKMVLNYLGLWAAKRPEAYIAATYSIYGEKETETSHFQVF